MAAQGRPFEIPDTAVSEVEGQLEQWRQMAQAGEEEIADLTEELTEYDELIEQLRLKIGEADDQAETF